MSSNRCPNCGGEVKDGKCLYCDTVCNQFEVSSNKMQDLVKEVRLHEIDERSKNEKLMLRNEKIRLIISLIIVAVIAVIIIVYIIIPRLERVFPIQTNTATEIHVNPYPELAQEASEAKAKAEEHIKEIQDAGKAMAKKQETVNKIENYIKKGMWASGSYQIGDEIPEGTYLLMSSGETPSTLFPACIYSDSECSDENIISTDTWAENSRYITISGDGYLEFSWCTLIDFEENDVENSPYDHSGMFLVGRDIEPGTYELIHDNYEEHDYMMSYKIYSSVDMIAPVIRQQGTCETGTTVTVKEGDFLKLERCRIKE